LPADLDDVALERRLFPPPPVASPEERCLPDCAAIHRELKSRKNVTLQLLWDEYKQANPLVFKPTARPTMKAMDSASVSRTVLVVMVRRSALCNISCASSCSPALQRGVGATNNTSGVP
jgi:hypothetical protein